MVPEKFEDNRPKKIIDEVAGEHPNQESDIGGTQSNVGHLGLTQDQRKKRFSSGIEPNESKRLQRSITSMRGEPEDDFDIGAPGPATGRSDGQTIED